MSNPRGRTSHTRGPGRADTLGMRVREVATKPVISLAEFARAAADPDAKAGSLGQRARAHVGTLSRIVHPAPSGPAAPVLDLAPALKNARQNAAMRALVEAIEAAVLPPPQSSYVIDPSHVFYVS